MNYQYRRDVRTDKEFKDDIKHTTKKEKFLVEVYRRELKHRGIIITVSDNGIDNTGKVIKGNVDCRGDFTIENENGDSWIAEIKNSPVATKCTFKVASLQAYVRDSTSILLFMNTGNINKDLSKMDYDDTRWATVTPTSIALMLENKKDDYYNEYMFGGKECLKILKAEYDAYFITEELTYHKGRSNDH